MADFKRQNWLPNLPLMPSGISQPVSESLIMTASIIATPTKFF